MLSFPFAQDYIDELIRRTNKEYLVKTYHVDGWENGTEFMEKLARRTGKLLKGGEPDYSTVAKMVINDWQRGKLPWFVPPSDEETSQKGETTNKSKHSLTVPQQDYKRLRSMDTSDDNRHNKKAKTDDVDRTSILESRAKEMDSSDVKSDDEHRSDDGKSDSDSSEDAENSEEELSNQGSDDESENTDNEDSVFDSLDVGE